MTDACLKELAGCNQLRRLDLETTRVTDAGLKELATFKQLRIRGVNGPAVNWLIPDAGTCLPKTARLVVLASSTKAVRRGEFWDGARRVATSTNGTADIFGADWRTTAAKAGRHVLHAVAVDAAGRKAQALRGVRVCR